jgi:hypothetical protein
MQNSLAPRLDCAAVERRDRQREAKGHVSFRATEGLPCSQLLSPTGRP